MAEKMAQTPEQIKAGPPEKPQPWMAQASLGTQENWAVWDEPTRDDMRAVGLQALKAQARLAGVSDDLLDAEPTEFTQNGHRYLRLKGQVDRGRPPHAQR